MATAAAAAAAAAADDNADIKCTSENEECEGFSEFSADGSLKTADITICC